MIKRFRRQCPSCQAHNKVISRCKECYKLCCAECSIDIVCIDCFVHLELNTINDYFAEKYGAVT